MAGGVGVMKDKGLKLEESGVSHTRGEWRLSHTRCSREGRVQGGEEVERV